MVRKLNRFIWLASRELAPGIPLNAFFLKGDHYAVWVDSGDLPMRETVAETIDKAGGEIRFIIHTHSHPGQIGNNGWLTKQTGALVAAHRKYALWHLDYEQLFQEYARSLLPEIIQDEPSLRKEVFEVLDEPSPVDLFVDEGSQFNLGGPELRAYFFSGHTNAQLGWYEQKTRNFLVGDLITRIDAPRFHGHVTVKGYRESLNKLEQLLDQLDVEWILPAHYDPLTREETLELLEKVREFLDRLQTIVLNLITGYELISLADLWREVCKTIEKQPDFRALLTVHAHVQELIEAGKVKEDTEWHYAPTAR